MGWLCVTAYFRLQYFPTQNGSILYAVCSHTLRQFLNSICIWFILGFPWFISQVVFTNQFLVRPTSGQTGEKSEQNNKKDTRINATDSATSTVTTNNETAQQQQSQPPQQQQQQQQSTPEFSFAETVLQKVGKPLKDVIEQVRQLANWVESDAV